MQYECGAQQCFANYASSSSGGLTSFLSSSSSSSSGGETEKVMNCIEKCELPMTEFADVCSKRV